MPEVGRPAPLRSGFLIVIVFVWTLVAFLPVVSNEFVNWDDPRMFLDNPHFHAPWLARVRYAWSSHLPGEFMPVTWMSYSVDRSLWGLHAAGYHLTSLLLHGLAALAVFALARRLLRHALGEDGPRPAAIDVGAAAAALVFAVHPLRVEPVAWVSARGTVLGGLLLVLSVLVYVVGWERGRRSGGVPTPWLAGSLVLFVASLLAGATGLVLPAVLVVLDIYPLSRLGVPGLGQGRDGWGPAARRAWAEKALFAVIGLLAAPMGFLARGEDLGDFPRAAWDPPISLAWAVYSPGFYVWKTIGIGTLSPMYPMPTREDPMLAAVLLSGATVAAITGVLIATRHRWPGALAAWIAYLILLGPMSGIVPFGRFRGAVDRYTYVACIGWALAAGGAVALGWQACQSGRGQRLRVALLGGVLVAALLVWSMLSWRQVAVWRDGVALWTRALAVVPGSPVVRSNLGTALASRGDFAAAVVHYREAAREWSSQPGALQNLGRALAGDGKFAEAAEPLRRLVELRPGWAEAHLDLGVVLYNQGDVDGAVAAFTRAVELAPGSARAHESLGTALWRQGRRAEAAKHLQRAALLRSSAPSGAERASPPPSKPGADGS